MKEKFVTPNPGVNYKAGKLFLFEKERVVVMKIDEHGPRAWEKTVETPFFKPTFFPNRFKTHEAARYIVTPPQEDEYVHWTIKEEMKFINAHVDSSIIREMAKFHSDIWQMCALAMRADGMDLIQSNPAIAHIVALNNVFMKRCCKPWRRARSLMDKKRRVILDKSGFEGSQSVVKILKKMQTEIVNKQNLFWMRWLLNSGKDNIIKPLRFLQNINGFVLTVLCDEKKRSSIAFQLLEELSQLEHTRASQCEYGWRINDLFRLAHMLRFELPRNIKTMEQINKIHDDLTEMLYTADVLPDMKYQDFPPPSIDNFASESFKIQHIKNTFELRDWGKQQRNCVLSYNDMIASGEQHIFRVVTREEEATLSIIPEENDKYSIDQLLSKCNKQVKADTRRYVNCWLNGLESYIKHWDTFPLPEVKRENFDVTPQINMEFILNLPFHEFKHLTLKDITEKQDIFFYQITKPEVGIIAVQKIHGQWDLILLRNIFGNDIQESTYLLLEQWLWDNTRTGEARQMKFKFKDVLTTKQINPLLKSSTTSIA